jgi:cation:H+ antiporter
MTKGVVVVSKRITATLWPVILGMGCLSLPAIWLRLSHTHINTVADTAIFGLAIVSAAFLLSWAAEAAEVDVSQGLAVAAVALIAVLPEYAVDMTFAWKAGKDPIEYAPLAVANMTGGNRLIIGFAWPLVFFLFWLRTRRHVLELEHGHAVEVLALGAAAVYAFSLPFKGEIALYDTVILAGIFAAYVYMVGKRPTEEPELIGPARTVGTLPALQRRTALVVMFVYAAGAIFASAEPFAEGLVHTGTELGIDHFLLVQWVAPFASEAPEFLIAGILAWRGRAAVAMGLVVSSAVNQWTLLVGGLPLAFSLSGGTLQGMPLDSRQTAEVLLTAAQCAFAVAIVLSLTITRVEAGILGGLFFLQFASTEPAFRTALAIVYILLALFLLARHRGDVPGLLRRARTSHIVAHPAEGGG